MMLEDECISFPSKTGSNWTRSKWMASQEKLTPQGTFALNLGERIRQRIILDKYVVMTTDAKCKQSSEAVTYKKL